MQRIRVKLNDPQFPVDINYIHLTDFYQSTPLIIASQNGHLEAVKILLEYGADISIPDRDGVSCLGHAIEQRHSKVAKVLLEQFENIPSAHDEIVNGLCQNLRGSSTFSLEWNSTIQPDRHSLTCLILASLGRAEEWAEVMGTESIVKEPKVIVTEPKVIVTSPISKGEEGEKKDFHYKNEVVQSGYNHTVEEDKTLVTLRSSVNSYGEVLERNNIRLERKLGSGQFGEVWKASIDKPVAVKLLQVRSGQLTLEM